MFNDGHAQPNGRKRTAYRVVHLWLYLFSLLQAQLSCNIGSANTAYISSEFPQSNGGHKSEALDDFSKLVVIINLSQRLKLRAQAE